MPQGPARRRRAEILALTQPHGLRGEHWIDAVQAFLSDKRREGRTQATLDHYAYHLLGNRITTYRTDHAVERVAEMTADALRMFDSELIAAGLGDAGRSAFNRVIKTFNAWCFTNTIAASDVSGVEVPTPKVREPETISRHLELRLLEATASPRDHFLVRFMINTGLRRSEVAALMVEDIVDGMDQSYVTVRQGKGGKDRLVPLTTKANPQFVADLRRYMKKVRPQDDGGCRSLFLSERIGRWALFSTIERGNQDRISLVSLLRWDSGFMPICADILALLDGWLQGYL